MTQSAALGPAHGFTTMPRNPNRPAPLYWSGSGKKTPFEHKSGESTKKTAFCADIRPVRPSSAPRPGGLERHVAHETVTDDDVAVAAEDPVPSG